MKKTIFTAWFAFVALSTCLVRAEDVALDNDSALTTPHWTATADVMFLDRRNPAGAALVENTKNGSQFLNATDFGFPIQAAWDLSFSRQLDSLHAVEVRYFALDSWFAAASTPTTFGDLLRVNTAVPVFTLAGNAVDASVSSRLHNFEINGKRRVGESVTLLAGIRYLELDDHLNMAITDAVVPFSYDTFTRNRLFGAQVGGDVTIWDRGGMLVVTGVGKAGVYSNSGGQDSSYSTNLVALAATGGKTTTAFVSEVGLTAALRLTEGLKLHGGYRLFWIDGVALATEQVAVSDFVTGQGFDAKGDTMFHGAFAGFEFSY